VSLLRGAGFRTLLGTCCLAALLIVACGDQGAPASVEAVAAPSVEPASAVPPTVRPTSAPSAQSAPEELPPDGRPELLSAWGQLHVTGDQLTLGADVTPYSLNSALFSDYTHKLRTVWLPDGAAPAEYHADETFDFPVGTVITKTFYYPLDVSDAGDRNRVVKIAAPVDNLTGSLDLASNRLIETRVLVHRAEGWHTWPYVWNDEQTEATLERTGDLVELALIDGATQTPFTYVVPDVNQCAGCHATNHTTKEVVPIGPKARHLNKVVDFGSGETAQLAFWQEHGLLGATPDDVPASTVWDDPSASLDDRARAYFDINCAHCHNSNGPADTSGLFLEPGIEVGSRLGICKPPIAAGTGTGGRRVGIAPGEPENSIFVYRMTTTDPGAMMPELGRAIPHDEGVDLISLWIESLAGTC